jgi:uncharacterized protein YegP (UPF0339 family)
MATATKKARPVPRVSKAAGDAARLTPTVFHVSENNAGEYRWEALSKSGVTLAQSPWFASAASARRAASLMSDGAAAARFDDAAPAVAVL